jgi:hypothetical protein
MSSVGGDDNCDMSIAVIAYSKQVTLNNGRTVVEDSPGSAAVLHDQV